MKEYYRITIEEILLEIKKGCSDEQIINMIEEYGQDRYDQGSDNARYD